MPVAAVEQAASRAGSPPAQARAVAADYGDAQLEALRLALGAVALAALLSLWFTLRLPASRRASPHPPPPKNSGHGPRMTESKPPARKGITVSVSSSQEMGPIDYIVLEWEGDQPVTGEVMPLLLDLVDRGLIRILDLAFMSKGEDGSVAALDLTELAQDLGEPRRFRRRVVGPAGSGRSRRGGHRARAGDRRRRAPVGEPLGRAGGHGPAPLRRSARRQRAHPDPGHPRLA